MANAMTAKEHCKADCPFASRHVYTGRGEVVECPHGNLFMVHAAYIAMGWSGRDGFTRLSRFWNPIKYKRARAALDREVEN